MAEKTTYDLLAVTGCPTGIAHTYMAADYLRNAGEEMGLDVKVEPQGSSVTEPLSQADIDAADAVIFATDVGVKPEHAHGVVSVRRANRAVADRAGEQHHVHVHAIACVVGQAEEEPSSRPVRGPPHAATSSSRSQPLCGGGDRV